MIGKSLRCIDKVHSGLRPVVPLQGPTGQKFTSPAATIKTLRCALLLHWAVVLTSDNQVEQFPVSLLDACFVTARRILHKWTPIQRYHKWYDQLNICR